jgi:two-component system invasion response regulator UvrY
MLATAVSQLPRIVLIDDHVLLRNGLSGLLHNSGNFNILFEADNGKDFISKLNPQALPDLVVMDINMPEMDGYETALWIKEHYPLIKILALSMYDNENAIIRMFRAGARGYILKDCEPQELNRALQAIIDKGYYYSELITGSLIHSINKDNSLKEIVSLNEKEIIFLKLVCSELTYKEIADKMYLSPRTIDGYRDALFFKLNIKTRVGLVLYAIKNGIVTL